MINRPDGDSGGSSLSLTVLNSLNYEASFCRKGVKDYHDKVDTLACIVSHVQLGVVWCST